MGLTETPLPSRDTPGWTPARRPPRRPSYDAIPDAEREAPVAGTPPPADDAGLHGRLPNASGLLVRRLLRRRLLYRAGGPSE